MDVESKRVGGGGTFTVDKAYLITQAKVAVAMFLIPFVGVVAVFRPSILDTLKKLIFPPLD